MIAIEMFPLWIYPWNGNNKWKYIFQICKPGLKQNLFLSRDFQFDTEHILVMNHWIVHRELFQSTRVVRACCTMQIKQVQYQQTNKQTNKQISKYNWGNPFNGKISYFSLYEETISLHVSNQWSSTEKALEIEWHRWRAHIFSKPYDLAFDSIYNPQSAFRLTTKVLNSDKMVLWSFGNTVKRTITTI